MVCSTTKSQLDQPTVFLVPTFDSTQLNSTQTQSTLSIYSFILTPSTIINSSSSSNLNPIFKTQNKLSKISLIMMASSQRVPKLGSFRHSFLERKEKLLSMKGGGGGGYSQIGIPLLESDDEDFFTGKWKRKCCSFRGFSDWIVEFMKKVKRVAIRAWDMGHSDPRKIIFSAKMGVALIIMSLLIFLKQPFPDIGRYSVWAILTVVVVFEFSIGK
jgi:hypothetical protein